MSKHIPGPWEAESCRVYSAGKGGDLIATCAWMPGQEMANARLISAAPDLLEALAMLLYQCERVGMTTRDDEPFIEAARAAIAKATGEQA